MGHVRIDGAELYREVHGTGDPVLLLHGGHNSIEPLRPQLEALAALFTVHAVERPGHGRSPDRPGPFSFDRMLADTIEYLALHVTGPVHVVGYSDGAILALLLGMRHPQRVRSVTAISANLDPAGFRDPDPNAVPGPDTEGEWYRRLSPDGPDHEAVVLGKLFALWAEEPHIDPRELRAIDAPTLVMAAEHDSIDPAHTRLIAGSIPHARLVIVPDATHGLLDQQPAAITAAVVGFLSPYARPPGGSGRSTGARPTSSPPTATRS